MDIQLCGGDSNGWHWAFPRALHSGREEQDPGCPGQDSKQRFSGHSGSSDNADLGCLQVGRQPRLDNVSIKLTIQKRLTGLRHR